MGTLHPLHPRAFSPSEVREILRGFDAVCSTLNVASTETAARELIATQVIILAERGVVDVERIHDTVCAAYARKIA
jgi:hypothetical protein